MRFIVLTMEDYKRACVAAVAAAIFSRRNISSVYDYGMGQYHMYSSNYNGSQISIYDYSRGGYMQGNTEQVYDYVSGSYVSLRINGSAFNGYDYESGYYFNGHLSGNSITFYDYEVGQYFNYGYS